MKSKLLANKITPTDQLGRHLSPLSGKKPAVRNEFIKWFNSLDVKPQRLGDENLDNPDVIQDIALKFDISPDAFVNLYRAIQFILRSVFEYQDDVHLIIDDLIVQKVFPEEEKTDLYAFFDEIKEKGLEFSKQTRRAAYEKGQIPSLEDIDYDVDLRLIPKVVFEPMETHIEEYNPSLGELISTALISLHTNDGVEKKGMTFQVNFAELEDLIVKLQACQKELRLMETISNKINALDLEKTN